MIRNLPGRCEERELFELIHKARAGHEWVFHETSGLGTGLPVVWGRFFLQNPMGSPPTQIPETAAETSRSPRVSIAAFSSFTATDTPRCVGPDGHADRGRGADGLSGQEMV